MPLQVFHFPRFRYAALVPAISMLILLIGPGIPASQAQRRGMRVSDNRARVSHTPGSRPGVGPASTRSFGHRVFVRGFPFRHHRHFRFLANACLNDPFFDPFLCRRLFLNNPFLFSEPILLSYPIYTESSYAPPDEFPSMEEDKQSELTWKIDRLTDEVERLRDQQAAGEKPQQPAIGRRSPESDTPSRILIFRSGQREEIQNYALVGDTLWILTEQRARKIPVSALEMETTKRENGERGLEFP